MPKGQHVTKGLSPFSCCLLPQRGKEANRRGATFNVLSPEGNKAFALCCHTRGKATTSLRCCPPGNKDLPPPVVARRATASPLFYFALCFTLPFVLLCPLFYFVVFFALPYPLWGNVAPGGKTSCCFAVPPEGVKSGATKGKDNYVMFVVLGQQNSVAQTKTIKRKQRAKQNRGEEANNQRVKTTPL